MAAQSEHLIRERLRSEKVCPCSAPLAVVCLTQLVHSAADPAAKENAR